MGAALCTLPEPDQQVAIQAEVESGTWAHYVHAHPEQIYSSYCGLDRFFYNLRLVVLTAAYSHFAYCTVLDHLGGRLPMGDWEELEQVGTKQVEGNSKPLCPCRAGFIVVIQCGGYRSAVTVSMPTTLTQLCTPGTMLFVPSAPSCLSTRHPAPGTSNHCTSHYPSCDSCGISCPLVS